MIGDSAKRVLASIRKVNPDGATLPDVTFTYWGATDPNPGATLAYLKTLPSRSPTDVPGHNPLGAWSVLAILANSVKVDGQVPKGFKP